MVLGFRVGDFMDFNVEGSGLGFLAGGISALPATTTIEKVMPATNPGSSGACDLRFRV